MEPKNEDIHELFLSLFAAHEPAIRAYVRRLVPPRTDAADVMQDVALVLWRKFREFDDEAGGFRGWAFGVARYETGWRICCGCAISRAIKEKTVLIKPGSWINSRRIARGAKRFTISWLPKEIS